MSESEENKTEEPTPFKLRKAREKGQLARGTDLSFFSMLVALILYAAVLGPAFFARMSEMMRRAFATAISQASDPNVALVAIANVYGPTLRMVAQLGVTVLAIVIVIEVLQLRGLAFSTHPLKPDFSRLNPGKGLKRLFSFKMLKETLKNVIKMAAYSAIAFLLIRFAIMESGQTVNNASSLVGVMHTNAIRLMVIFAGAALIVAAIDQVISRQEFTKQMRMSKSEVQREHKDREGEPRLKQKRKDLHKEFAKQTQSMANLPGSDMLIVNPEHYAVALRYDADSMEAPTVSAKGRNLFALQLKRAATLHQIPIFHSPALARALHRNTATGQEIGPSEFRSVADLYLSLHQRNRASEMPQP